MFKISRRLKLCFERPAIRSRTRILIIDDHVAIARGLQAMLTGSPGLQVIDVEETGETALATIAAHGPDAVIVDAILQGGVSGTMLIRQIRRRFPDVTIIATSASVGAEGERQLIEAGAHAVMRKVDLVGLREELGGMERPSTPV